MLNQFFFLRDVFWAGRPRGAESTKDVLEPRRSFKAWGHTVFGRCRRWTDEQIETAGVLALVYGKVCWAWLRIATKRSLMVLCSLSTFGAKRKMLSKIRIWPIFSSQMQAIKVSFLHPSPYLRLF